MPNPTVQDDFSRSAHTYVECSAQITTKHRYRVFCRRSRFIQSEYILHSKEFTLLTLVTLHALEVSARIIQLYSDLTFMMARTWSDGSPHSRSSSVVACIFDACR